MDLLLCLLSTRLVSSTEVKLGVILVNYINFLNWKLSHDASSYCLHNFYNFDEARCNICFFTPGFYSRKPNTLSLFTDSQCLVSSFQVFGPTARNTSYFCSFFNFFLLILLLLLLLLYVPCPQTETSFQRSYELETSHIVRYVLRQETVEGTS